MGFLPIAGLVAAIAGAAMNSYAQQSAQRRAQAAINDANLQLQNDQKDINKKILEGAQQYQSHVREAGQQQESKRITSDIMNDVSASQKLRDESQAVQGNVSNDYEQALQTSKAKTADETQAYANLVGNIRGANALRMNEGFNLDRLGEQVGMMAKDAQGHYKIGQENAQNALNSRDGLANFGSLLQAVGSAALLYGGVSGAASGAATGAGTAAAEEASKLPLWNSSGKLTSIYGPWG